MNIFKLKTLKKIFLNFKIWSTLRNKNQYGTLKIFATNREKSTKFDSLPNMQYKNNLIVYFIANLRSKSFSPNVFIFFLSKGPNPAGKKIVKSGGFVMKKVMTRCEDF